MPYKGNRIVAVMLVGGSGKRLWPLTGEWQSKATLRVAGKRLAYYNADLIEDAGIDNLVVPVQFNSDEVTRKLAFEGYKFSDVRFSKARQTYFPADEKPHFRGTADAVMQSKDMLAGFDYMLIVPCDHITNVDYSELIKRAIFNWENYGSIATVGAMTKAAEEIKGAFGNPKTDKNGRVTAWIEKPKEPISNLASLGIYACPVEPMLNAIEQSAESGGYDFGQHVMKFIMDKGLLHAHDYPGEKYYWNDVGLLKKLHEANMDLIRGVNGIKIPLVKVESMKTGFGGLIEDSVVSKYEPAIYGTVRHSVVGDHCIIDPGVEISDSVLMGTNNIKSTAGKRMLIKKAVLGKYALISDTPMEENVVGKMAKLHGCRIKPGVSIDTDTRKFNETITEDLRAQDW